MFSATLFYATLFLVLFDRVIAGSNFTINTPHFVQCETAQIHWTKSVAPYKLSVVSAQNVCGAALIDLGSFTTLATNFTVDLAAGTQVVLFLEDADGNEAWSDDITVASSNITLCFPNTTATPTSTSSPLGVANAGASPTSGALVVYPLKTLSLLSVVASVVFFAF